MSIDDDIAEMQRKLAELQEAKLAAQKAEEAANNKITITLSSFHQLSGSIKLNIDNIYSFPNFHTYLETISGRVIFSSREVNIPAIELSKLFEYVERNNSASYNPKIEITWIKKDHEAYELWISKPDLNVTLVKNSIFLEFGPKYNYRSQYLFHFISGVTILDKGYSIPISELYNLPNALVNVLGVTNSNINYSDEVSDLLFKQLESRKTIAELANATDAELDRNPFTQINPDTGELYFPKPHHRVAIKHAMLANGKDIIAYDMGTGKSGIGIAYAELKDYKRVLIICPASLKTNWRREIKKFMGKEAAVMQGVEPDALAMNTLLDEKTNYFIINYEILGRGVKDEEESERAKKDIFVHKWVELLNTLHRIKKGFDLTIIDEGHYIKNMGSKRSQAVLKMEFNDVLPMTGTPIVNRPNELYPLLHIIKPEVFKSPDRFAAQFTDRNGNPTNLNKLHEMLMPYMIRRTRKDIYGDSTDPEKIPFTKDLSPVAKVAYQKVMEGVYISLRDPNYIRNITSILAQLMRCKQVCSADNIKSSADLAMDALEDTGKKVLIFSQFKDSQIGIARIIGDSARVINGDVVDEVRYDFVDLFQQKNDKLQVIVTNIIEGLTLTEAHTVIFNDLWWTPKDHNQAEGRAFGRDNDPHGGNSYYIQNEDTIDEFITSLLVKKTGIFKSMIDGIRDSSNEQVDIVKGLIEHLRGGF